VLAGFFSIPQVLGDTLRMANTKISDPWTDNREWNTLLSYLPPEFHELAVEHKQLETQFGNAKVATADDLLRFFFLHVGPNLPLRQTVVVAAEAGGPRLSAMRLHMKMRKAPPYLHALVRRMVTGIGDASAERWFGYEMISLDGSSVSGPGATGTDARLHTALRLSDLSFKHVEVTGVAGGETLKRFGWSPGELAIGDRGYANPPGIAWVVRHGADVLVRVNRGALPLFDRDGTRIDVLQRLRSLRVNDPCEWKVQVDHVEAGEHHIIKGRLVAVRLPQKKAEEARRRVLREHGKETTEEQLEAASYVVLFTTAPRGRLPTKRCLQAYRLRWQIELQFKRWKSLCDFHCLPNFRDDTILAWLYTKVLLGLLMDRMSSSATEVFPPERFARRDGRRRSGFASAPAPTRPPAVEDHVDPVASRHRRTSAHATV
jgi:hypothetical protein